MFNMVELSQQGTWKVSNIKQQQRNSKDMSCLHCCSQVSDVHQDAVLPFTEGLGI